MLRSLPSGTIPGLRSGDELSRLGYPKGEPSYLRVLVERGGRALEIIAFEIEDAQWFYTGHEASCDPLS